MSRSKNLTAEVCLQFQSQAINAVQERLDYDKYVEYLNTAADDLVEAATKLPDRSMHSQ